MAQARNAAVTSTASSASSVTLLSERRGRVGFSVYNDSTQVLYVKYGATASTSSYTVQVIAGGFFEDPFQYSGRVDGIWASANGNARVTEVFV